MLKPRRKPRVRAGLVLLTIFFCHAPVSRGETDATAAAVVKANRIYKALTSGAPLLQSNPLYTVVVSKVAVKDYLGAATVITDPTSGADDFYNNTVADLAQTMNQDGTAVGPRTELSAMFLGVARDALPVDALLTQDFTYVDPNGTAAGVKYAIDDSRTNCDKSDPVGGSFCNSLHYVAVWDKTNPRRSLVKISHPSFPGVGIFTSWPWAKNYDFAGTGRRNIKGMMENLFLVTMDAMRTDPLPDNAVRQDVPRDDPHYVDNCKQCHSWMDHWVAPWLVKDVQGATFVYQFRDKLNDIRGSLYPVTGTGFDFFYSQDQQGILGIDEKALPVQSFGPTGVKYIHGGNLNDFANIIAHSRGFYRGLVKRIVAQIYMKKLFSVALFSPADQQVLSSQQDSIEAFTDILVQKKDLRDIYHRIAVWYSIDE